MDAQRLQLHLKEIQTHIDDFRKELAESETHYRESLKLLTDPELRSLLMEHHVIYTERQRAALTRMETLHDQVQDQLAGLNKSN